MEDNQPGNPETAKENFEVGYFRSEDAEGIVNLFNAVYGDSYPIRLFYDPAAIIAANEAGEYYSIVARTVAGNIIGVSHLYRSAPYPSVYEAGVSLVLKEYRNTGANTRIMEYLHEEFVPQKENIEAVVGEAVCNHVFMQKTLTRFKHKEMAMEIALMPAAYAQEQSARGRVATLACFRSYKPKPHAIHIPKPYEKELRWLYSRLDDGRDIEIALPKTQAPKGSVSRIDMEIFDFAQVARFSVHEIGDDFVAVLSSLETQAIVGKVVVFQVWLNLTCPWVASAVKTLMDRGYFFGGALPRWFDGDGLLMQKVRCSPDFEDIVLETVDAKQLLEIIEEDWERTEDMRA
jgi:hypothetical protein